MDFDVDIFISYAHIDNLSLKEGAQGWIAAFHKALEIRLAQLIGEKPRIWRDQKLQGNDFFGDEIVKQFPHTAMMISILSPRYLKSEWCTKEVKEFYSAATKGIGTRVGNKSRILKIIKTRVPFDAHPPEIVDTLGYEFYITDEATGKAKELHERSAGQLEHLYWGKLDDIAHDIRDLLEDLKESKCLPASTNIDSKTEIKTDGKTDGKTESEASPDDALTVYLAETTSDLHEYRDMVKRQLRDSGYRVVPDSRLALVKKEFVESVEKYLEESVMSLHLVGSKYGLVPEGATKSIVSLQNDLAVKRSQTGQLHRLIWLMEDKTLSEGKQQGYIDTLRSSPEAQYKADLFETSIEDFKSAVLEKLDALKHAAQEVKNPYGFIRTVYLAEINHELDAARLGIREGLLARGCKVLPEEELPLVYNQTAAESDALLDQCDLSIHLLGDHYAVVPEETEKSIPAIQLEQAAKKCTAGKLERLVLLPSADTQYDDKRQEAFITAVKDTDRNLPNTRVWEAAREQLADIVFEKLENIDAQRAQAAEDAAAVAPAQEACDTRQGPANIYVICDKQDLENEETNHLTELEDYLFDSGCEVVLPLFDGSEEEMMTDHQENLKNCDAVIIFYGAGGEPWMRSISRDLSKIAGYGRSRPLEFKAAFLAPPETRTKKRFRSHELFVINAVDGFFPSVAEPFVAKLKQD
ncbi:MAG: hypothetical protein GY765_13615 [bacterium]|nr:hypothetical protein [bacterium]